MSYDWKKIKEEIRKETQDVFSLQPTFSIDEALELFRKILEFPTNRPELKLDGLPDLLEAIERILIHNQISGDNFNAMALPFEAYLKKLLYLVNQPFYLANAHNITLGDKFDKNKVLIANGLIRELQLNPGNYQYWQRNMPVVKLIFDEHLWRAYNLRNSLAHFCTTYNRQQFWQGVQSYLVMYLYAAHKHKAAILQAVEPYFLSAYLQQYIADYQQWQTLFVPIAGIEFEKIEIWASEVPEEERPKQGQDNPEDDKKKPKPYRSSRQMRGGTVNELRRTIQERQMIVIAEPGMGKSTSLQYIAYTDAQAIEAGDTNMPYPVYLELKLFQQGDVVKQRIIQKLGIDAGVGEKLLAEGKITLLLDGLNEVAESNRNETIQAVKRFMEDYPDVFVLLTTRPNAYERYWFDNIRSRNKAPIFQLQQMELPQIEEFLQKNSAQEAADIILHAIEANEALKNIIKTPLLLKMLITNISRQPNNAIPPTETGIILAFLEGMGQWEQQQNANFNPKLFLNWLAYLAHQVRMKYEANTPIPEGEVLQILKGKANEDTLSNFLTKAVELHLLEYDKTTERYSFVHEVYQEALWAKQQAQFDKYPPAANSGIQYVPAIELWHKTGFKEALRLYSALLTGQKRFDFVREIGKRNVLLAARCKTACWHPEPDLQQMIVERAKLFAVFFDDAWKWSAEGITALIEMDATQVELADVIDIYEKENGLLRTRFDSTVKYIRKIGGYKAILTLLHIAILENVKVLIDTIIEQLSTEEKDIERSCEKELGNISSSLRANQQYKQLLDLDASLESVQLFKPIEFKKFILESVINNNHSRGGEDFSSSAWLKVLYKYNLPEFLTNSELNKVVQWFLDRDAPFVVDEKNLSEELNRDRNNMYNNFNKCLLHLYADYNMNYDLPIQYFRPETFRDDFPSHKLSKEQWDKIIGFIMLNDFEIGLKYAVVYGSYPIEFFEEVLRANILKDWKTYILLIEKLGLQDKYPYYIAIAIALKKAQLEDAINLAEKYYTEGNRTRLQVSLNHIDGDDLVADFSIGNEIPFTNIIVKFIEYDMRFTFDGPYVFYDYIKIIKKYKLQERISYRSLFKYVQNVTIEPSGCSVEDYLLKEAEFRELVYDVYGVTQFQLSQLVGQGEFKYSSYINAETYVSTFTTLLSSKNKREEFLLALLESLDRKGFSNIEIVAVKVLKSLGFYTCFPTEELLEIGMHPDCDEVYFAWLCEFCDIKDMLHNNIINYINEESKKHVDIFFKSTKYMQTFFKLMYPKYSIGVKYFIDKLTTIDELLRITLFHDELLKMIDKINNVKLFKKVLNLLSNNPLYLKLVKSALPELLIKHRLKEQYPLELFLEKAMAVDLFLAEKLCEEWKLWDKYSKHYFIKEAEKRDILLAYYWNDKYRLPQTIDFYSVAEKAIFSDRKDYLNTDYTVTEYPKSIGVKVYEWLIDGVISDRNLIMSYYLQKISNNNSWANCFVLYKALGINWVMDLIPTINWAIEKGYLDFVSDWYRTLGLDRYYPIIGFSDDKEKNDDVNSEIKIINLVKPERGKVYEFPQFEPPGEAAEEDTLPPEEA
ncbi:hypothetical protein C7N43_32530 [Sphingobacteriales bacterium UPWRP_1]|nr:hypothetical protein BVG80_11710 [Sphingobacteriales bacterium TSM_CSM]PSJ72776.1 hypothetical protein C7N43_32530 [Sphingobacteriales bacterium UPWRP_1]